jgi:hypothetical protein
MESRYSHSSYEIYTLIHTPKITLHRCHTHSHDAAGAGDERTETPTHLCAHAVQPHMRGRAL